MVYPTLIAAVSDASQPRDRARTVGVYRFWRDFGFVLGALIAGIGADAASPRAAILIVAILTGASGLVVVATRWQSRTTVEPSLRPLEQGPRVAKRERLRSGALTGKEA